MEWLAEDQNGRGYGFLEDDKSVTNPSVESNADVEEDDTVEPHPIGHAEVLTSV